MPKRYSPEIRRTALEFVNQGQTQIEVAQALGVNPKTLSHWVTTAQARIPEQQRNELEELKRLRLQARQLKIIIYLDDDSHTFGHPKSQTFGQCFRCR